MLDTFLLPAATVTDKGDGPVLEIASASNRVFLLALDITDIREQQSLDITIFGSPDGATFAKLAAFPQKFYRGQHPLLLDLRRQPDIRFVRAHWETNRWGRHLEGPWFQISIAAKEVAPELLAEATAAAQARL